RIQRPRLVRFESCWRADRSTSAVVDPNHHLRESRTMADSVRDGRICDRSFRSGGGDTTYPAWPAEGLGAAFPHRNLWRLLRRGHRFFNAGCFYAIRHAGYPRDEWPRDGGGGCYDEDRCRRVHCGKRGALAGSATDVRKLGRRLLHGRALGAAAWSPVDPTHRYRTRSRFDHILWLAWRLTELERLV